MQDDLVELQTQIAFQERTISELNEVLTSQQAQIDQLRFDLRQLQDVVRVLEDSAPPEVVDERPPHY